MLLLGHRARLVQQLPSGGGLNFHFRELELDRLELVDRLPELPALAGVGHRVVGRTLRDPNRLCRRAEAGALERAERHRQPLAGLADDMLVWTPHLVKDGL